MEKSYVFSAALTHWLPAMFLLLCASRGARVAATSAAAVWCAGISIVTPRWPHTDRSRPKPGQQATFPTALFYLISLQWHHSYTVYFGLYVGLPPVVQADLDRLRRQTSHYEALFAYLTYPKYIFTLFIRGQHLSNMFTAPQLNYVLCQVAHRVLAMKDVYIRLWHTHNMIERRIYTPVAVDVKLVITKHLVILACGLRC